MLPLLVLVGLPMLYLSLRTGLPRQRHLRWLGGVGLCGLLVASLPYAGVDLNVLKTYKFFLALAATLILILRQQGGAWIEIDEPTHWRRLLLVATGCGLVIYCNFFAFHGRQADGQRVFVHLHELAHNYLGAKYYAELGYTDLYTAILRAEAELFNNHFRAIETRDLKTYQQVHIRSVLERSDPVKASFSPSRWVAFKQEVSYFRHALGPEYGKVLLDHGFNATPVWALFGRSLSQWVAAGSSFGMWCLTLLDLACIVAMCLAIGWAFGIEAALLSLLYLCVLFGAGFAWIGGALLRFGWLCGVVVGVCCLHKRHYAWAGVGLAVASGLRIFPVFFLLPLAWKAGVAVWRYRRLPRRYVKLFGTYAATVGLLLALTAGLPKGLEHWVDFGENIVFHHGHPAPNLVGLSQVLSLPQYEQNEPLEGAGGVKTGGAQRPAEEKGWHVQVLILLSGFVVLGLIASHSRRQTDAQAAVGALPLLFVGLNLAAYYYVCLVLLVLVWRNQPRALAVLFGIETVVYCLLVFDVPEALLHRYHSGLIGLGFIALAVEEGYKKLL